MIGEAGAAWFESKLIDYDVYSNQGNWAYISGCGTDPRGGRFFNVEKQQKIYDGKFYLSKLFWNSIMKKLHVILGNQLFPINEINKKESSLVFMAEDYDLCSEHKNHKLKILNFLVSMREYRDQLKENMVLKFFIQN